METKLTVGTYNLRISTGKESRYPWKKRFWIYRMWRVAKLIKRLDLDVVMVQECKPYLQLLVLMLFLPKYRYRSTNQKYFTFMYNAILVKRDNINIIYEDNFEVSSHKSATDHSRIANRVKVYVKEPINKVYDLISVHCPYVHSNDNEVIYNIVNAVSNSLADNIIMAGDFNALPESYLITSITENTNLKYKFGKRVTATIVPYDETEPAILDYIFSTSDNMHKAKVAGNNLMSDHLLVYTKLK